MSIKDIIAKAKESEPVINETINLNTSVTSSQDNNIDDNSVTIFASNPDSLVNRSESDLKRKGLNLDVPAVVKNHWMGKIKGEGKTFKQIVVHTLISQYGLPDNWSEDDLIR